MNPDLERVWCPEEGDVGAVAAVHADAATENILFARPDGATCRYGYRRPRLAEHFGVADLESLVGRAVVYTEAGWFKLAGA